MPNIKDLIKYGGLATSLILAMWLLFAFADNQREQLNNQNTLLLNHAEHTNLYIQEGNVTREQLKACINKNTDTLELLIKAIDRL